MTERGKLPFWFDDGIPTRGASEGELAAAEAQIGHKLPAGLRELLHEQDGGVSNYAYRSDDDLYIPLPGFFNIATVISASKSAPLFGTPAGVIAIASDDEAWLGLDYRTAEQEGPSVVYQASEEQPLQTIAKSFASFVANLIEDE